jgi:cellulose synthase/poly-beta-1,6-N-acetylglucosamine synthase-like glycosyltransferase
MLEVLVARGTAPSRQRNEAVRQSSGEVIVFLDDDSLVSPGLLGEYLRIFERDPRVAAAGGPAEPAGDTHLEKIFGLVLSEPLLVGRTASRYARRGRERFTDKRELILCNLAVRRRAFLEAGGFDESLYPNEENELLERLRLGGSRLVHSPAALVRRRERRALRNFLRTVWRYGRGRGLQLKVLRSRTSIRKALLAWAAAFGAVSTAWGILGGGAGFLFPAALYLTYMGFAGARLSLRGGLPAGLAALGAGFLLHATYAAGILDGLLLRRVRRGTSEDVSLEEIRLERSAEGARRLP